jgi:ABC-type transport system involved in multi-copper enzyme maturation permease subunit
MKNELIVAELRRLIHNPLIWLSAVVLQVLSAVFVYRGPWLFETGIADFSLLMDLQIPLILILLPLFAAPSWAGESRRGTDRLLLAGGTPVHQVLLGKLAALSALPLVLVLANSIRWIVLSRWVTTDPGAFVAQLTGLFLLSIVVLLTGLFFSVLTRNRISAYFLSLIFLFPLVYLRPGQISQPAIRKIIRFLSLGTRFDSFASGCFDMSDLGILLLIILALGFLTMLILWLRHGRKRESVRWTRLFIPLALGFLLVASSGRIVDLRNEGLFRISAMTRELIGNLEYPLYCYWYRSDPDEREAGFLEPAEGFLKQWALSSGGRIRLKIIDAGISDHEVWQNRGLIPLSTGNTELWSGLIMEYGGELEVIPFFTADDDSEFRLAVALRKLTGQELPAIGLISGSDSTPLEEYFSLLTGGLGDVMPVYHLVTGKPVPEDLDAVILLGQDSLDSNDLALLERFRKQGGALVICAGGLSIDPGRDGNALGYEESPLLDYLKGFRVTIVPALVGRDSDYPLKFGDRETWLWASPVYFDTQQKNIKILRESPADSWMVPGSFPLEPEGAAGARLLSSEGKDRLAYPLAVRIEPETGGKLAVIGSQWGVSDITARNGDRGAILFIRNLLLDLTGDSKLLPLIKGEGVPDHEKTGKGLHELVSLLFQMAEGLLIPLILLTTGTAIILFRRWRTR